MIQKEHFKITSLYISKIKEAIDTSCYKCVTYKIMTTPTGTNNIQPIRKLMEE